MNLQHLLATTSSSKFIRLNLQLKSASLLDKYKFASQAKSFLPDDIFIEVVATKIFHLEESFRGP